MLSADNPEQAADLGELFHAAFRGLRRSWSEQLAPFELTPHQWRALMMVNKHHGDATCQLESDVGNQSLRLKELAQHLRIAPRSATEVVDQLESKDLVRRAADPNDRRATLIVPTAAGTELFGTISKLRREQSQLYFAQLNQAEQAQLSGLLGKLIN